MKLISWNVAGFRACLKKGFEDFFYQADADVFCIQESKVLEGDYHFHPEGYKEYLYPAKKKGYSGTLVYSKVEPISVTFGLDDVEYDDEGRTITLEFEEFYLINVYVPNVKRNLERMDSRMRYEVLFREYIKKLDAKKTVIVCGDFNVAHTEIDIKNAKQNQGNAGFTLEERQKFTELLESGFIDTFRFYHPGEIDHYSWWSYMGHARERNIGWRIDYFIISERSIDKVSDTMIYSDIYGSDHCPIGIKVDF